MAWNYQADFTLDRDKVRHLVGDTLEDQPLLTDEEIAFHISEKGDPRLAAADAADAIATRMGREVTRSAIGLSQSPRQSADYYRDRATQLRADSINLSEMFVGGRSITAKQDMKDDSDLTEIEFELGMDDNPNGPDSDDRQG